MYIVSVYLKFCVKGRISEWKAKFCSEGLFTISYNLNYFSLITVKIIFLSLAVELVELLVNW